MTTYIALLRAINVGGTGKLPMKDLIGLCENVGFTSVRTYIQSGNVLFSSDKQEPAVLKDLRCALHEHMGQPADVFVRTAAEMHEVVAAVPFPDGEPGKVHVAFLTAVPPAIPQGFTGPGGEQVRAGRRELYLYYPEGQGKSKLRLPLDGAASTSRNLNTVTKLAELAGSGRG